MATFWFETCVEGYFWWKLPVGRQFKRLQEYSPLPSNHDQLHHHQLQWWREEQITNTVAKNKLWKERRMRLCLVCFSFWETTT